MSVFSFAVVREKINEEFKNNKDVKDPKEIEEVSSKGGGYTSVVKDQHLCHIEDSLITTI